MSKHSMRRGSDGSKRTLCSVSSASYCAAVAWLKRVVYASAEGTSYHAGDTALFSDMALIAELHAPELAFLPIGDHFTMGPRAAARACRYLGVGTVVPIHWGTFPILSGTPSALRH